MASTPIGLLTGDSIGQLRFRTPPDEAVHLGEILVAESESGVTAPFFLRVVDLAYGAEARDGRWGERAAGALLSGQWELYDRDDRLYRMVTAAALGYLEADGRFRRPKTLPGHFATVRRLREGDLTFLAPKPRDLQMGHVRSGDAPLPERVGLDPGILGQHVGIFATTGMGKSNLLKVLAGSCLESGRVGLLVLDPHGEYADGGGGQHRDGTPHRGLLHHPWADERLVVYTSRPLPGFDGQVHDLAVSASEVGAADFASVYKVSEAQQEALWAASNTFGRSWLVHMAGTDVANLAKELGGNFHEATLNVLQRRAQQLLEQDAVHQDEGVSTTQAILDHLEAGKVVLVDTSGLFPKEELLVSTVLARGLLGRYRRAYRDPDRFRALPPTCILLEEAQRVLGQRVSENIFAQIAREGRKFKVGLGAVTQQPRLVDDELLSQFNTLFLLGLADPTDRQKVRDGARQDLSQLTQEIQMLEPGEAILSTPGAPFAIPLKADLYEERIRDVQGPPAAAPQVQVDEGFY
ncbi:MAG: ATP-binding protein [Thermoplasmatota archaeon]